VSSRAGRSAGRIAALAAKEVLHIQRDPRTLILALVMPVVMLLLFGYGVSFDLDRLPIAVADGDRTPESRALVRAYTASRELVVSERVEPGDVQAVLRRGQVVGALVLRPGYGRDLARGRAEAAFVVDGADASTANQVLQKSEALAHA
jgi:ABC-2 type transport system permease protein